jgi:translocation and assembly module TamB
MLQILTVQEPTQFGVRYRLNDNILLRGTTNLEGDNRAVVEFETRF